MKIGTQLSAECVACGAEEIWEVESVKKEEYEDGIFETYQLKAIKHCVSDTIKTSLKNSPEMLSLYKILPP